MLPPPYYYTPMVLIYPSSGCRNFTGAVELHPCHGEVPASSVKRRPPLPSGVGRGVRSHGATPGCAPGQRERRAGAFQLGGSERRCQVQNQCESIRSLGQLTKVSLVLFFIFISTTR